MDGINNPTQAQPAIRAFRICVDRPDRYQTILGVVRRAATDPAIAENGFVTLEDTEKLFGSQNIVPLVRADRADEVRDTLNAVSAKLTTQAIADMLKQTDIEKKDPQEVAQQFLADNGLGG